MARQKRKKSSAQPVPPAAQQEAAPENESGLPLEEGAVAVACSARSVPAHGKSVSRGTFVVGLLLALMLGMYLGSLAPAFFVRDADRGAVSSAPMSPGQMPSGPMSPGQMPPAQTPAGQTPSAGQAASAAPPAAPAIPPEQAARIAALEKAVLDNPSDARNWTELGNLYFDTNQPGRAVTAYQRSLALAPDNADVITDMGIMFRELGEFEKAVAQFRRASSVSPRHENALFNEGVVLYYDLQRRDDAMKAWQRLLAVNPAARTPDGKSVADMLRQLP